MLDIRLKSKYKIFLGIAVAAILAFALLFTWSYPTLDQMSREYQSRQENRVQLEQRQAEELASVLMNSAMTLTKQVREQEEGKLLTNIEAYVDVKVDENVLKQYEDEYELYLDMIEEFFVRSNGWKRSFDKYRNVLSYEVISSETDEVIVREKGLDFTETEALSKLVLVFDNAGKMTVKELKLNGNITGETEETLRKSLEKYHRFDPLGDYLAYLSSSKRDIKHEFELRFKPPTNLEFVYYFNSGQMFGPDSVIYTDRSTYFFNFIHIAVIFTVILGGGLSFLKDYRDRQDKTNVPLEVLVLATIAALAFSGSVFPKNLILTTLDNNLSDFLFRAGIFKILSEAMIFLLNVLTWTSLLGVTLWVTISLCAVFHLGPKRYFLERTLTGMFLTKLGEIYRFVIRTDIEVNWNDSAFRQFGKWIGLNFLVLLLMAIFRVHNFFGLLIYSLFILAIVANYYNRKKEHFRKILKWMDTLAKGELFFEEKSAVEANPKKKVYVNENLGEFEPFDERLRLINDGFIKAVDKERESQRSKSELITNMSHDLKTPLTAIIMYINLLKDENIDAKERRKYIEILDAKSMRFKSLIDDLFEMSLASTGKLKLEKADVDIVGLLKGLRLEYNEKIEEAGIDFRWQLPGGKCVLSLDAKKTYRIFENLLVNITKYALKGSRAYIVFSETADYVDVTLTNISDIEITSNPEELLERFARADTSRNTPGSGLGLAIAKNLTEAQGGEISIDVEGDVFKINIRFFRNPK